MPHTTCLVFYSTDAYTLSNTAPVCVEGLENIRGVTRILENMGVCFISVL